MLDTKDGSIAIGTCDASAVPTFRRPSTRRDFWRLLVEVVHGRFARSVLLLSGGVVTGQAVCVASAPILTRLYRPEDLGVLAVFIAAVSMISIMGALRYEVAIPLPKDEDEAANVFALSVSLVCVTSALFGLLVWLWGQPLIRLTGAETLRPNLWLVPLGALIAGLCSVSTMWMIRQRRFAPLSASSVIQALAQVGCQVAFGFSGVGPSGLLAGDVVGRGAGAGTLLHHSWPAFRNVTLHGMLQAISRYWRFPILSSWAVLLNTGSIHLPLILVAAFYDLRVAGWLALSQRVLGMPTSLVSRSVAKVYLSESARLRHDSPQRLLGLFWKTLAVQSVMACLVVVAVGLPAPLVCGLVFGEDWRMAGWYILILSAMFTAKMVAYPLGATLDVLEKQGWHIFREVTRLVLMVAAVLTAVACNAGPLATVAMLSIASSLAYGVGIVVVWRLLQAASYSPAK